MPNRIRLVVVVVAFCFIQFRGANAAYVLYTILFMYFVCVYSYVTRTVFIIRTTSESIWNSFAFFTIANIVHMVES